MPLCRIPQLTAANFPHLAINLLRPLNPTKYALFVTSNRNWHTVCLPNKLATILDKLALLFHCSPSDMVMYFRAQSCLLIVINYLQPPETDQNMPYLSPCHWPVQNSTKFREKHGNCTDTGKFRGLAKNSVFHWTLWFIVISACCGISNVYYLLDYKTLEMYENHIVACRACLGSSLLCCMVWRCDTDRWLQLALCWQGCVCWTNAGLIALCHYICMFCIHLLSKKYD